MKTAGVVILMLGLFLTLVTGISYIAKEKVVDLGEIEITQDQQHRVHWQPYIGIGVMLIGGSIFMFGRKQALVH